MTRKHFLAIAKILNKQWDNEEVQLDWIILDFAEFLATTNPNFDSVKFVNACNLK